MKEWLWPCSKITLQKQAAPSLNNVSINVLANTFDLETTRRRISEEFYLTQDGNINFKISIDYLVKSEDCERRQFRQEH